MHKIKILTVGKVKESWLDAAIHDYTLRLTPVAKIEWMLAKNDEQLATALEKETGYIALDPQGKTFSSEKFSSFLHEALTAGGCRLSLVIGGAEGLTPSMRSGATALISLSPLTFTHQLTRVILLEQIYRAFEIEKGSGYHK
jgi:23S rRNA (pseudouridine1915-N3)-methyltransferase